MDGYPDGVCEASAPWNQPEPWETETCGTCRWNREASIRGLRTQVCCCPDCLVEVMPASTAACPGWEGE